MGSKGRMPPHHMRHPLPGPGVVHPEPFGAGIRPPPGGFPPIDMLPPPEILEQKLAAQHMEMERLATENRRLAATHGTLRQQLAHAQQELQMLESQIGAAKSEREQQMRGLVERISKMEAELQAAEQIKLELQQARAEAQSLVEVRQELMSKAQQMKTDLQRASVDMQQIPALLSELNRLREEFYKCRSTYEHERKIYHDHLESLQVMDKEYMTMAEEVSKLRAELNNTSNIDKRAAYGTAAGYGENDASGHDPSVQSSYEDGYGVLQVHAPYPVSGGGAAPTAPVAASGAAAPTSGGTPTYVAPQPGPAAARAGYENQRGPTYDASRGAAYDPQGGHHAYNPQRVPGYDAYRGAGYDMQRTTPYDPQRSGPYDVPRGAKYNDAHSRNPPAAAAVAAAGGAPAPVPASVQAPANSVPYGSVAPTAARPGTGHETHPRGGNTARR